MIAPISTVKEDGKAGKPVGVEWGSIDVYSWKGAVDMVGLVCGRTAVEHQGERSDEAKGLAWGGSFRRERGLKKVF